MGLDARLRLARVYLCTDAREKQGDLEAFLSAAFAGGVDIVQIRQKGMAPEAELAALEIARQAAAPYQGIVEPPLGRMTMPVTNFAAGDAR